MSLCPCPTARSQLSSCQLATRQPVPDRVRPSHRRPCAGSTGVVATAFQTSITLRDADQLRGPLSDDTQPVLYTHLCCPYAQRSLLCFLEKDTDLQIVSVDLARKPSWYPLIHPSELVPAVSFQGRQVIESIDIARWVSSELPGPALMPGSKGGSTAVDEIVRESSSFASRGLAMVGGRSGMSWGIGQEHSSQQRKAFEAQVQKLQDALDSSGGPYLAGQEVSIADMVVWPFMERFELALQHFQGYSVRDHCGAQVVAWMDAMHGRPSSRFASPDADALLSAFKRHKRLDFFDFTSYHAASIHPHLQAYLVS